MCKSKKPLRKKRFSIRVIVRSVLLSCVLSGFLLPAAQPPPALSFEQLCGGAGPFVGLILEWEMSALHAGAVGQTGKTVSVPMRDDVCRSFISVEEERAVSGNTAPQNVPEPSGFLLLGLGSVMLLLKRKCA